MVQSLGIFAALIQVLGSIPSSHLVAHNNKNILKINKYSKYAKYIYINQMNIWLRSIQKNTRCH